MDWIKKHYDQFALGLIAVLVLACAIMLFLKTQSFPEQFSDALSQPVPGEKVPPIVLDKIDEANTLLKSPPKWDVESTVGLKPSRGSLFMAQHYMLGEKGVPIKPGEGFIYKCSLTGEQIPNAWFIERHLPLFDPTVPFQDADKDGFPNEIEFAFKTDPLDANSHPPYYKMLFLKQVIRVPFRLKFQGYDGDPKKDKIDKFSFQINTMDLRQPSEFPKIGEMVPGTKFKLEKFEFKMAKNTKTDEDEDVSELTVVNQETNDKVVLILNKIVDSPDYFILFDYQWPSPAQPPIKPSEFKVKKLGTFLLRPNVNPAKDLYKLVDIKDDVAVIQLPDGQKTPEGASTVEITKDPRKK